MDSAVEEAVRIGDDYGRVDGVTVQTIERTPIGFDATVALQVGIEQTDIEDAVTAAYEYCRSELSEYDCTMAKIERNQ
jgi:ACT domain-containing protein